MSHNEPTTLNTMQETLAQIATEHQKATAGNKAAATRARVAAAKLAKLCKQFRAEILELSR